MKKYYPSRMEEMFARWIRETVVELEKAKKNQNVLRAIQMKMLQKELMKLRDKLVISTLY